MESSEGPGRSFREVGGHEQSAEEVLERATQTKEIMPTPLGQADGALFQQHAVTLHSSYFCILSPELFLKCG